MKLKDMPSTYNAPVPSVTATWESDPQTEGQVAHAGNQWTAFEMWLSPCRVWFEEKNQRN
jgi:hypothetical protein